MKQHDAGAHPAKDLAARNPKSPANSELLSRRKSNCGFCIVEICRFMSDTFLNKGAYIIHSFNVLFSLHVYLLLTYYLLFVLYLL